LDAKKIHDFDAPQIDWMQVEGSIRKAVEAAGEGEGS
jgi:hypothetical protein